MGPGVGPGGDQPAEIGALREHPVDVRGVWSAGVRHQRLDKQPDQQRVPRRSVPKVVGEPIVTRQARILSQPGLDVRGGQAVEGEVW